MSRAGTPPADRPRVGALVLAAGRSERMGETNKLLTPVAGAPMLVHAVEAALASEASPVVVVTGHQHRQVADLLSSRDVLLAHNAEYEQGLSSSLSAGLAALPPDVEAVVVCLGDMPRVQAAHIDRLIAAFDPARSCAICVPTCRGRRGNPVLWARRFFGEMRALRGDVGAKALMRAYRQHVCEVRVEDDAVLVDVDTPEQLERLQHERLC